MLLSPALLWDFNREFLAPATRAIDRTFYKKRCFVMASTNWRAIFDGQRRLARLFVAPARRGMRCSTPTSRKDLSLCNELPCSDARSGGSSCRQNTQLMEVTSFVDMTAKRR